MSVTVIHPGRLVKVEPDEIDEKDTLEIAEALIDEHGHAKGGSGSEASGWSIHGAIGEGARRITNASGKDQDPPRALRDAAKDLLEEHHGKPEFQLNDDAADGQEAIRLMREARLGLPSTATTPPPPAHGGAAPTSQTAGPTTPGGTT